MNTTLKKLKEDRAKAAADMRKMVADAEAESRGFTGDEETSWNALDESITGMDARIKRLERSDQLEADGRVVDTAAANLRTSPGTGLEGGDDDPEAAQAALRREAFGEFMRSTHDGLTGLSVEHRNAMRNVSVDANGREQRAQGVGTNTAGGYLVPTDLSDLIIETMQAFGGIRNVATVLNTSDGRQIDWPTNDDTGNAGVLIAENTASTEQDLTMGTKALNAYAYTSRIIRVSNELLQDSAFDMDSFITRKFGERLGRPTSAHYATGTGTDQPNGLMTAATVGKTTAINSAITHDEMLDLKHSVDPAYRALGSTWLFNDSTLLVLKKLKDANGLPLWLPSLAADAPSLFDGDPYVIDQGIATIATTAVVAAYGDMSQYVIRDVLGFTMMRLVERYAEFNQVGFVAHMRTDADLMDTGAVKTLQMAA